MNRAATVVLAAVLAVAGCGVRPTDPISFGEAPSAAAGGQQVYFVLDGALRPSMRAVERKSADPAAAALDLLAAGPLPAERAAGFTSELPAGTRILTSTPDTLFLVSRTAPGDPDRLTDLAAAQIACTVVAAHARTADRVDRVTLMDKAGHRRGPLTCPLPVPGRTPTG